jgi:hypothetical protein
MSELIVLGLIPGTKIQITFILWVLLVVGILASSVISFIHRTHFLRNWVIGISFLLLSRQTIARPQ